MYNGFAFRKSESTKKLNTIWSHKFEKTINQHTVIKDNYASISNLRVTQWVGDNMASKTAEIMQKGISSLYSAETHQFRDYSPKGSIYLRSYIPEKTRILLSTSKYFQEHYIQEPYNGNAPNISKAKWLRERSKPMELSKIQKYKDVDENSRVQKAIGDAKFLGDPIDGYRVAEPIWRPIDKTKYMNKKGFVTRLRTTFSGKYDAQVWETVKLSSCPNEFKGGFSEIGEVTRKREKEKEISTRCFSAANPVDTWKNRLNTSCSWRTHAAESVLKEIREEAMQKSIMQKTTRTFEREIKKAKEGIESRGSNNVSEQQEIKEETKEEQKMPEIKAEDQNLAVPLPVTKLEMPKVNLISAENSPGSPVTPENESSPAEGSRASYHEKSSPHASPKVSPRLSANHPVVIVKEGTLSAMSKTRPKFYKKSLDKHYADFNVHPMKSVVSERDLQCLKNLSASSARIFQAQQTFKHWTSGFKSRLENIPEQIKQLRRVKTPLENLIPRQNKELLQKFSITKLKHINPF